MLKIALLVAAIVVIIIIVVVVAGLLLPVAHVASRQTTVPADTDRVFAVLTDIERYPAWRSDVKRVEVLSRAPVRWMEEGRNGRITFERIETDEARRIVTRIADAGLPFGGTWTYELAPSGGGTMLTITERGEIYNPVFRFMSRFVFGYTATIDRVLEDLRRGVASQSRP